MATKKSTKSPKGEKTPQKKSTPSHSPSPKSSPKVKSPKSLPDVTRRVRDCCVSWHECIQKWEGLNDVGTNVATKLANLHLQKQYSDVEDAGSVTVMNDLDQAASYASRLEEEIVKSTEEMSKIVESLKKLQTRMQTLLTNFQAIEELQNLKKISDTEESSEVISQTWSIHEFCKAAEKLVSMYSRELTLKENIWPEYTRTQNRNMQLVLLSLWIHQPYLEDGHKTILQSMLMEVDLK